MTISGPEEPFTETGEDNLLVGYTDNYMKVVFEGSEDLIGQLVKVKILKAGYPYNKGLHVVVRVADKQIVFARFRERLFRNDFQNIAFII